MERKSLMKNIHLIWIKSKKLITNAHKSSVVALKFIRNDKKQISLF